MSDPIDWQGRRQHGTRSSYSGGCRCTPCRQAQAEANRYYDRRKSQEKWGAVPPLLVDSEPSRRHVQALMAGWLDEPYPQRETKPADKPTPQPPKFDRAAAINPEAVPPPANLHDILKGNTA